MTFRTDVWAVDGNTTDALVGRLQLQAATLGSQGVIGHLDCQVNATGPATAGIIITPGGVVILGQEVAVQGSYQSWNVGNDLTLTIGSTGGSPRSDLIVARAEDPTFSGSQWTGSAGSQIVFPRVISGVAGGTTKAPGGMSAIPLARIDMPASTATVQQSFIHDLRTVCNPQITTGVLFAGGPGTSTNWTVSTTPHQWPPGASWSLQIPSSATSIVLSWQVCGLLYQDTNWARGFLNPVFGSSVTSPVLSFNQTLVSMPAGSTFQRFSVSGAAQASIPASLRGTTQTLQFAQVTDGSQTGVISIAEGGQTAVTYQFQQLAATA